MTPLLEARGLVKTFKVGRNGLRSRRFTAVDDVDLTVDAGETVGLVGESGSGKSTTGLMIARLLPADAGSVMLGGRDFLAMSKAELSEARRQVQVIFQDPFLSLNPKMRIADVVGEPLRVQGQLSRQQRVLKVGEALDQVGLGDRRYLDRLPRDFSGGQRQRVAIARALVLEPRLIVADEVVSALDVSSQAGIVNLLQDLQSSRDLAVLFVSHDLSVVRHISDRVAVMYRGRIVESGRRDDIYGSPRHPYTQQLLDSVLRVSTERRVRELPQAGAGAAPQTPLGAGCMYASRCPVATPICAVTAPVLETVADGHEVACHRYPGEDARSLVGSADAAVAVNDEHEKEL